MDSTGFPWSHSRFSVFFQGSIPWNWPPIGPKNQWYIDCHEVEILELMKETFIKHPCLPWGIPICFPSAGWFQLHIIPCPWRPPSYFQLIHQGLHYDSAWKRGLQLFHVLKNKFFPRRYERYENPCFSCKMIFIHGWFWLSAAVELNGYMYGRVIYKIRRLQASILYISIYQDMMSDSIKMPSPY